jgi:hypothetical protein
MSIARRNHGRGHSYLLDGSKGRGATTILGNTLAKKALVEWAGKTTAAYAVDHWAELTDMSLSKRLEKLNKARYEDRDAAANRGTDVHALAEQLVNGRQVDVPEPLAGHVESYVDFLNTWEPDPVLVESVVANRKVWYCGTLDLVADLAGTRWLLDVKTSRSGIFGETALQLAAYGYAEVYLDDQGDEQPMADLGIERYGAIHVRADGWDLYPLVVDDEVWSTFRHLAWIDRILTETENFRDWVGPAITPIKAVAS